jgi:hypothetical protein
VTAPGRACHATEAGYHTAVHANSGHNPVSEQAKSTFLPRMLLEHYRRGIPRTDLYTLVDQWCGALNDPEAHFGLFDCHWQPKAAAHAVRNLLLVTAASDPLTFPAVIRLGLDNVGGDVRKTALRAANGDIVIALWRNVSVYDVPQRRDLTPPTDRVEVNPATAPSSVRLYLPVRSTEPQETLVRPDRISVELGGEPVVLRVTP